QTAGAGGLLASKSLIGRRVRLLGGGRLLVRHGGDSIRSRSLPHGRGDFLSWLLKHTLGRQEAACRLPFQFRGPGGSVNVRLSRSRRGRAAICPAGSSLACPI